MIIDLPVPISDSSVADGTNPAKSGLTPTILAGVKLADGTAIASENYPTFTAGATTGANGLYSAHYDPEANGEALFQVDAGSGLSKNVDRFFYLCFTRDSGRVLSGFQATGQLAASQSFNNGGQTANLPAIVAAYAAGQAPPTVASILSAIVGALVGAFPVVAGSTASSVVLTVPANTVAANWAGRSLRHLATGNEAAISGTPTLSGTTMTVALGSGFPTPATGDLVMLVP